MSLDKLTDLYRTVYKAKVKVMSRILGGDVTLAEDVVQEAFTRAVKYILLFDEEKGLMETWFNAILFNALRDIQKQERNYQELYREIWLHDVMDPSKALLTPEYKRDIYLALQEVENDTSSCIRIILFVWIHVERNCRS